MPAPRAFLFENTMNDDELTILGKIGKSYGVKGWMHIHSDTEPATNILNYNTWQIQRPGPQAPWETVTVSESRPHGSGLVAKLAECHSPEAARDFTNALIAISRAELPNLPTGEYYWADLEGLQVITEDGVTLGTISHLFETGANDVIAIKGDRERLLPYIPEVVKHIDLAANTMTVEWDAEFCSSILSVCCLRCSAH